MHLCVYEHKNECNKNDFSRYRNTEKNIVMKKYCKFLFFISLANCISYGVSAQSALSTFSPSSSTLIGNASRIGYHYSDRSSYYMRYNDTSYLCCAISDALVNSSPSSNKIPMPQDFVISDFKKFRVVQGFIGSYQGVGMFGRINEFDILSPSLNIHTYKLPAVDRLSRIAIGLPPNKTKAYAIGETFNQSAGVFQSFLMEFYAEGVNSNAIYKYAPLACNLSPGKQEFADDVITLNNYVIFATRYIRSGQKTISLRISDTTDVLSHSSIDFLWQLLTSSDEVLSGKLRLIPLDNNYFILAYIMFDGVISRYYLCVDRISLHDLLLGINNSIVSHKIMIEKDCSELTDIIFEPDVRTLVILLNGERSEFYHVDPYSNTDDNAYKLDYLDGNLFSIDTIGDYMGLNGDRYFAMGEDDIFWQDISNGVVITNSCLPITKTKFLLHDSPRINIINEAINRYADNRVFINHPVIPDIFYGSRTCIIIPSK